MTRILVSVAAAAVLVAGAFAAVAITGGGATAQTVTDTTTDGDAERPGPIKEVLDELVADGTLTPAQADTVLEALRDEFAERRGDRIDRRHRRFHFRQRVRALLEDGVISADELAELGDDHILNDPDGPFGEALEDGQITEEEFKAVIEQWRREHGSTGQDSASPTGAVESPVAG